MFQLIDQYYPEYILEVEYYCLILLLPLCVLCQIKYLKWLGLFSIFANLFLVLTYLICLYYIFGSNLNFANRNAIGNPARYPAFIS